MATDGYEWDPRKAAENLRKHGVDFDDAGSSSESSRPGEPRPARYEPMVKRREKGI